VPPILCKTDVVPLSAGEGIPVARDQFMLLPLGEQELQIDQLGESSAYPDQPLAFSML